MKRIACMVVVVLGCGAKSSGTPVGEMVASWNVETANFEGNMDLQPSSIDTSAPTRKQDRATLELTGGALVFDVDMQIGSVRSDPPKPIASRVWFKVADNKLGTTVKLNRCLGPTATELGYELKCIFSITRQGSVDLGWVAVTGDGKLSTGKDTVSGR